LIFNKWTSPYNSFRQPPCLSLTRISAAQLCTFSLTNNATGKSSFLIQSFMISISNFDLNVQVFDFESKQASERYPIERFIYVTIIREPSSLLQSTEAYKIGSDSASTPSLGRRMGTGDSGLFWRQCFALSLALGSWDFYTRDEIIRDALRVEAIYIRFMSLSVT
jgi:hypothetical protein